MIADGEASEQATGSWCGLQTWTLLDTAFGQSQHFLATCAAWLADPLRPHMLHYVGIVEPGEPLDTEVLAPGLAEPAVQTILQRLVTARSETLGFQRISFEQGRISLTLCRSPLALALTQLRCRANAVFVTLHAQAAPQGTTHDAHLWDKWSIQKLGRLCRRGARLRLGQDACDMGNPDPYGILQDFETQGFEWDTPEVASRFQYATFAPSWTLTRRKDNSEPGTVVPGRAAVIGAGMAGASVARALAVRGWEVSVFEEQTFPASGASGLPVGLVVPQVSADDNPRSRLSRHGVGLMLQHAADFLDRDTQWKHTGVSERKPGQAIRWHTQAAWVKPKPLVQAWLQHPRIRLIADWAAQTLTQNGTGWILHSSRGQVSQTMDIVIVANAMACVPLLLPLEHSLPLSPGLGDTLRALQPSHGTVTSGQQSPGLPGVPATPVNGHGSLIPSVPELSGLCWYAGASFESDLETAQQANVQNAANLARLRELLPEMGAALAPDLTNGTLAHWSGTRCIPRDRLPLVGAVQAQPPFSLFLCAGMGARGLSFSALCAELLVAQLGNEPLPLETSLAKCLDARRTPRKRTSAQSVPIPFAIGPKPAGG